MGLKFTFEDSNTNWKYLLIVIILAFIVGGGILVYQYKWWPKTGVEVIDVKLLKKAFSDLNFKITRLATISGEVPNLDSIYSVVFYPNGQKVAYIARKEQKEFVIADNKESGPFDSAGYLILSPDSSRLAYVVREGESNFVIVNGRAGKRYNIPLWHFRDITDPRLPEIKTGISFMVESLTFSPNSKHLAYRATVWDEKKGSRYIVVLDEKEIRSYGNISGGPGVLVFSPDSQRLAYLAHDINGPKIIVREVASGKEREYEYADELISFPQFSSDNQLAWVTCKTIKEKMKARCVTFINGQESQTIEFDYQSYPPDYQFFSGQLVFSPDGKHLSYAVYSGESKFGEEVGFIVRDGKIGKKYKTVYTPKFSPDSNHLAYFAYTVSGTSIIVVNENENEILYGSSISPWWLIWGSASSSVWSLDSKHIAYVVERGEEEFVVVDGKEEGKVYNSWQLRINDLVFSPNSKYLAYVVREKEKEFLVISGKESKSFDKVWSPVFSGDSKHIAYGAKNGNELLWVVEKVENLK